MNTIKVIMGIFFGVLIILAMIGLVYGYIGVLFYLGISLSFPYVHILSEDFICNRYANYLRRKG